jgi:F0F1-type ATP synthase assembly protein I
MKEVAEMKKGTAAFVGTIAVIGCCLGGMIIGAIIGNMIVPARLDWSAQSGPGLLLVGAIVGLFGGFAFGIRTAMRIVDNAAAGRRMRSGRLR